LTTGINPKDLEKVQGDVSTREYEEDDEPEVFLCVERATHLIYEVQYFTQFVLVRPASPAFRGAINQIGYSDFTRDFDEYMGNPDEVHRILWGNGDEPLVSERK
jgi:hypothetical protein